MSMPSYRKHKSGAREVFDVARYVDSHAGADIALCATCHRFWDDAVSSGVTPAPSGRCPFEYQHPAPRKTEDVWVIESLTVAGWELETTETTRRAALVNLRLYRENSPNPVRMRKTRERIMEAV